MLDVKYETPAPGLRFHHIGIAVREPAATAALLTTLGYSLTPTIVDKLQNVHLVFCTHPSLPSIEIIFPTNTAGPIDALVKKHRASYYHVCFSVDKIQTILDHFEKKEIQCIPVKQPEKAVLFNNQKVSFYHIEGFGLVEFLETSDRGHAESDN